MNSRSILVGGLLIDILTILSFLMHEYGLFLHLFKSSIPLSNVLQFVKGLHSFC